MPKSKDPAVDQRGTPRVSKEELDANAQKALEEAEKLRDEQPKEPENEPDEQPPVEPEGEPDNEPKKEPKKQETPDEKLKRELAEKDKKLRASSREGQILYQRNKQITEAIEKASELPDPTEDELVSEFPDWEVMNDFEKKMARQSLTTTRRLNAITEVSKSFKELEAWEKSVDEFLTDPANIANNPALEGMEDDFKLFATKPTRRGVDMNILISSFLYEKDKEVGAPRKQMFESGSGGPSTPPEPKSDMVSIDEARMLRQNNYSEYKRLLREGKIKSDL